MKLNPKDLEKKSKEIRRDILRMVAAANASHVGSALSCTDILTALFFNALNVDPKKPEWKDRDRIILSKGHGGVALIAAMAHRGFFPAGGLKKYCTDGSTLTGHTMIESIHGIEATTGSLGHGLSLGIGMALAARSNRQKSRVFVVLSDGELDEGSNWEAIMAAAHFGLDNLVAIVDFNKIQSFGTVKEVMNLEPLSKKFDAFNWKVKEIDGHNFEELISYLNNVPFKKRVPSAIIAHTIKGKGISFMENKLEWHYKSPNAFQLKKALSELR